MKYNFDEVVLRQSEPGSYSSKWDPNGFIAQRMGFPEGLPEDRICYFLADMDYRCPPGIQAKMQEVINHNVYGYTSVPKEYYKAICDWYARRFDWHFSEDSIILHHGTHTAVAELVKRYTKEGDGVILFTPSYGYTNDVEPQGRHLVKIPFALEGSKHVVDWAAFEEAAKAEENTMLILIQPHNPTGRCFTEEELKHIGQICEDNGVLIVSDEVHIDFARDGVRPLPVMKVLGPKNVITTTAINKIFNTAGLSVTNTIIANPELKEKYGPARASTTPFGVAAVLGGYNDSEEWVDELNTYMDKLMHHAVDRFHEILPKVKVEYPEGTYILWLDFSPLGLSDEELNKRMYHDAHVFIGDGSGMDPLPGTQMKRMCLTSTMSVLDEAMDRLAKAFADVKYFFPN